MGSIFHNEYPYTDFHELNADWILKKVNELATDWLNYKKSIDAKYDTLESAFKDLKEYVEDYFDKTDFKSLVEDEVRKYATSGQLALMVSGEINLKNTLDLKSDGSEDISTKVNGFIESTIEAGADGLTMYIPSGRYRINAPINIPYANGMTLHSDNGTEYFTDGVDYMFIFGDGTNHDLKYTGLDGGYFNAKNVRNACIYIKENFLVCRINNIIIRHIESVGIMVGDSGMTNLNLQPVITNCQINGEAYNISDNRVSPHIGIGIMAYGTDGIYNNISMVWCKKGFGIVTGGNKLTNIHIACGQSQYYEGMTETDLENIVGIEASGGIFTNVQIDNYYTGVRVNAIWTYDVRLVNYTYNVESRNDSIFESYMQINPSAIVEIPNTHEGTLDSSDTVGNCLEYDLRIVRGAKSNIHSHRIKYPAGTTLTSYQYLMGRPSWYQRCYTNPKSFRIMPLIDDAFRVYGAECFNATGYRDNLTSGKWYLLGYVSRYGAGTYNTTVAKFNIAWGGQNADISIYFRNADDGIELNGDVKSAFSTYQLKMAIDKERTVEIDGITYYPLYIGHNRSGQMNAPYIITTNAVYMPYFFMRHNQPLGNPTTEPYVVDAILDESHMIDLF